MENISSIEMIDLHPKYDSGPYHAYVGVYHCRYFYTALLVILVLFCLIHLFYVEILRANIVRPLFLLFCKNSSKNAVSGETNFGYFGRDDISGI